jgi:hypothetical protein
MNLSERQFDVIETVEVVDLRRIVAFIALEVFEGVPALEPGNRLADVARQVDVGITACAVLEM